MSDSEDDWFTQDIDDIVQKVKDKIEIRDHETRPTELASSGAPFLLHDSDYGGSYGENTSVTKPKDESKECKTGIKKAPKERCVQSISLKKLSLIADQTALNVFLEVFQKDCGFFELFEKSLHNEFTVLTVKTLAKLCELPLYECKNDYLNRFVKSQNLLKHLTTFIKDLINESFGKKKKTNLLLFDSVAFLHEIAVICKSVVRNSVSNENFNKLFVSFDAALREAINTKFSDVQAETQLIAQEMRSNKLNMKEIYPTLDELTTDTCVAELKPNIIKGKYQSVNEYLQIHQALLREDFISPLRDEILKIKKFESVDSVRHKKFHKKVKFYIHGANQKTTHTGDVLLVDLWPDQRALPQRRRHEICSKDLMYGSLLCFSSSLMFEDMVLATVHSRDEESSTSGFISVELIKMYNISSILERDFIMLESEVFFPPYHHVHRVLQTIDENNFPMKNFIVDIDKENYLPDYMNDSPELFYKHKKQIFNPLDVKTYPESEKLQLDDVQLKAYQMALSKKFSLIQGPPGTGKTYIGLEIVSTLIKNVQAQVLVICFTNHALDQFLMEIVRITENVVRMGNQSRNEVLDKYNVKQINDSVVCDRRLKACYFETKNEYLRLIQEFETFHGNDSSNEERNKKVLKTLENLRTASRKLEELKQISEYNFIKDKKVIGMTTTFAARSDVLLKLLKTPIVVVEEAAEVLETHIIASLTKETQHVILIGDHQQLRPTTSVYKLSQKYKMDISLFERMVNNDYNCICLQTQHRMRPEIADLLKPTIYKTLENADSVHEYDNIKGVAKNMFFIDHTVKEAKSKDETTIRNIHEAEFLVCLADYLLKQGYSSSDIVLLTTYNGQLIQLRTERKKYPSLRNVRTTVVDNFQGEESKIVLLSLVRSNDDKGIGYMGTKNRICVALSRAKEAFFAIGNMNCLAKNSEIWRKVCGKLISQNAVGTFLPLQCQQHKNITKMKEPDDFESVKLGGCTEPCNVDLPCGHTCSITCHNRAIDHRCSNHCSKN